MLTLPLQGSATLSHSPLRQPLLSGQLLEALLPHSSRPPSPAPCGTITAARPARCAGLVLIAPALDFTEALMWAEMTSEQRAILQRDGVLREPSQYSDQPYEYHYRLIEEGRDHLILDRPIDLACPVRILQGMRDPDVPWQHALKTIEAFKGGDARLTLLKDGDHRLSRQEDIALLLETVWSL